MKNENLEREQKKTKKDVLRLLNKHGKCLLIRPTGFGKTHLAIEIMKKYDNIVFLYPSNVIGNGAKERVKQKKLKNVEFYSYNALRNLYKDYEAFLKTFAPLNSERTLVIFDESHGVAATVTSRAVEKLMLAVCPDAHFLGMTATPMRTDKLEIKWHYFNGHTAYEYDVTDAIRDGLFMKPHYVYTSLDNARDMFYKQIDAKPISQAKKNQYKEYVRLHINPQRFNITNLSDILEEHLDKFKNDKGYYKFIVFFSTYRDIHAKKEEVINAFKKLFPTYDVNEIIISSESVENRNNLKKLDSLHERPNTVDLIFNINMLTQGYHTNDITGVIMYRHTTSNIIYTQQVGRCLDVTKKESSIIFDLVENLTDNMRNYAVKIEGDNRKKLNRTDPLFNEESAYLDNLTAEFIKIQRMIDNSIKEEFEEEIVRAYRQGLVDISYCVTKLELHNKKDFIKLLKRY